MHKRIERRDGSVVVIVPRQDSKSVTWEVMFKVGSRQESASINGVSHFVEHLMFKGTKRRPTTQILSREFDSVGAEYNAFTGKDATGYYVQTDMRHANLGIDLISDMLHNSLFDKKEMDRERNVIVEELNMFRDNPLMRIDELFEGVIFERSALGMEIGGPREVIKTVPHAKLVSFKKRFYYPGNMVVGVAGPVDAREVAKTVDTYFPLRAKRSKATIRPINIVQKRPRIFLEEKETNQVQLMLGFPGLKRKHRNAEAMMLLSVIMGGSMSSRLFISIRERKGLAYDVRTSSESYEDVGYFAVRAGLDKERIFPALKAIRNELDKAAQKGVTKEELKRAKDNIRGRLTLKFESQNSYLTYLLSQELLTSNIESLEKKLAKIDSVTHADVNRLAKKTFRWAQSNLALIGPFKDAQPFVAIMKS